MEWSNSGVSNWKKGAEKIKEHEMSEGHQFCCTRWQSFTSDTRINQLMDKERAREAQRQKEQVEKNKSILTRIIEVVILLARQNSPFRGHREQEGSSNKGNFLEYIEHQA